MTSWDLRQDDDVKLFGLELKSKDIDQTDWQIQNTQFQDSLSETCNVRGSNQYLDIMSIMTTIIRIQEWGHSVLEGEMDDQQARRPHTRADYFWF